MLLMPEILPYNIVKNKILSAFNHSAFFSCGLVYYGNRRCHFKNNKKGAFELFTCIFFAGCQLLHNVKEKYGGCQVIIQISYIYYLNLYY